MPTNTVVGSARAIFTISLVAAATEEVRVDWATKDGTALAGRDYETNSGTVAFAPGETTKTVEIFVHGRTVETEDRVFYVLLDPPVNALLADEIGACVIHVDTTGTVPVVSVIIPRGEKGLTGDSAYQIALNNGFVGSEPEWLASLRPSPAEIAPLVAPLIDANNMSITAAGTETLTPPDTAAIKQFASRIAYMMKAKKAIAASMAAGANVIPLSAFAGDSVDPTRSAGFKVVAVRAGALATVDWLYLPATAEIKVLNAQAGDIPLAVEYDVGSGNVGDWIVSDGAVQKSVFTWLNDLKAGIDSNTASLSAYVSSLSDPVAPGNGVSRVARAVVSVPSMMQLQTVQRDVNTTYLVSAFYDGAFALADPKSGRGGGAFKWCPEIPHSAHNGVIIISPTVPLLALTAAQIAAGPSRGPWNVDQWLVRTNEQDASGKGCFFRLGESVDVREAGARGDNVTNDGPSLQAWLKYTQLSDRTGTVSPGVYSTKQVLKAENRNLRILGTYGTGSTFKAHADTSPMITAVLDLSNCNGPDKRISDVEFIGPATGVAQTIGLHCKATNGVLLDRVWFRGLGIGLYTENCSFINASQCAAEYCTIGCQSLGGLPETEWFGWTFYKNETDIRMSGDNATFSCTGTNHIGTHLVGLDLIDCDNASFTSVTSKDDGTGYALVLVRVAHSAGKQCKNNSVNGIKSSFGVNAVRIEGSNCKSNKFLDGSVFQGATDGIVISQGTDNIFDGWTIRGCTNAAWYEASAGNNQLTNFHFDANGYGIYENTCDMSSFTNGRITGSTIADTFTTATGRVVCQNVQGTNIFSGTANSPTYPMTIDAAGRKCVTSGAIPTTFTWAVGDSWKNINPTQGNPVYAHYTAAGTWRTVNLL